MGGYAFFEQRVGEPVETLEVPGPSVTVILDLQDGWKVEGTEFSSFAGGLYDRPIRVRHEGAARGLQFDLEPLATRTLLGVPAGELAGETVQLEDLLGKNALHMVEAIAEADTASRRFQILDQALLAALPTTPRAVRPEIERAWNLLKITGGQIRIERLAQDLNCSRRHLARHFAEHVGASPKLAARLIRLGRARESLGRAPLATVAIECGFSDQAHMTREFLALAGAPPTKVPFVQDAGYLDG